MDWTIRAAMFGLMFAMGLTLTFEDFQRIARAPLATILGTLLQLVGMPVIGIAIAFAYDLPPMLAVGLVVIAACPGGMFSNLYVHIARGNSALSITLTSTATMVTLFTLPLWVGGVLSRMGGAAAAIDMPVLGTALQLASLTALPVAIGMVVRRLRPGAVAAEKRLSRCCAILIVVLLTRDAFQQPEAPVEAFQQSLMPALWLAVGAIGLGMLVPALFGLPMRDAATIAVELVVKNGLLGIVIVSQALPFEALVPILAFAIFQTPGGVAVLVGWRLSERYRSGREPALPALAPKAE